MQEIIRIIVLSTFLFLLGCTDKDNLSDRVDCKKAIESSEKDKENDFSEDTEELSVKVINPIWGFKNFPIKECDKNKDWVKESIDEATLKDSSVALSDVASIIENNKHIFKQNMTKFEYIIVKHNWSSFIHYSCQNTSPEFQTFVSREQIEKHCKIYLRNGYNWLHDVFKDQEFWVVHKKMIDRIHSEVAIPAAEFFINTENGRIVYNKCDLELWNKIRKNEHRNVLEIYQESTEFVGKKRRDYLKKELSNYDKEPLKSELFNLIRRFSCNGNIIFVKDLFESGIPEMSDQELKDVVLSCSVKNGHIDLVEYSISLGANVNKIDDVDGSILSVAKKTEHKDMIKLLIKNGAEVGSGD